MIALISSIYPQLTTEMLILLFGVAVLVASGLSAVQMKAGLS
jgi:hypothetical protein